MTPLEIVLINMPYNHLILKTTGMTLEIINSKMYIINNSTAVSGTKIKEAF